MNPIPVFSNELVHEFNQALLQLASKVPELMTACVATRDGFEITQLKGLADQRKLAAMASSMHALGDAISVEVALGVCRNVIVEGGDGRAVMLSVPYYSYNKVLIAAASSETNLALLLISTRDCCTQLAAISREHTSKTQLL